MNFKDLIEKIISGEKISAEELASLRQYDPEPLQKEIASLQKQISELSDGSLSENGRLLNALKEMTADRDDLSEKLNQLSRRKRIEEIARFSGCEETDYLEFIFNRSNIDIHDEEAVKTMIAELKESHPGCFASQIKSGGGSGIADPGNTLYERSGSDADNVSRLDHIIFNLGQVPFEE